MGRIRVTSDGAMLIVLSVLCWLSGASWAATLSGVEGDYNLQDIILDPTKFGGVTNFSTFLLDRSSGLLFLGARDAILSVDTNQLDKPPRKITWDVPEDKRRSCVGKGKTEVDCHNYIRLMEFLEEGRIYVCGTHAFEPQCAFLELPSFTLEKNNDGELKMETGKGKCPFEPSQHYTAVMAGGTLYTAATSNFLGTLFDISRATGPEHQRIRTEQSINWLSDPEFVSSAFIEESAASNPTGDDDKIYFFFTEVAKEYDLYTKVKVPRVARVCKSDVGGMKTLQRRWTTFLKAQLVCEDKPSDQRYNILTDVFTMQHTPGDPSSTHFYGLFTSQWEREELSAVCVFSLSDIIKVMDGPFKELKKTGEGWNPVPTPRPGQCLNNALKAEGLGSSLNLPDKVLTFVRDHPLMENSVTAAPLLVRKGTRYTKLAVTQIGAEPIGVVLHLGTDRGELHQVEVVGQNTTLLQEIPLFASYEPVNNILLHKGQALVGSPLSLARVQAEGCALYPNCELCARARGLGCVWSEEEAACRSTAATPGPGDSVEDALRKCDLKEGHCSPSTRELQVSIGLRLLLPCVQLTPRPCTWEHPLHRHTRQHHSDLDVTVTEESLGKYICTCQEVRPGIRDHTPCRRAAYHLTLKGPNVEGTVATASSRHVLAIYILFFCAGVAFGMFVLYFLNRRRNIGRQGHQLPDNSLSSGKGQDLLGSSATPQSPSSASLLSEGFRLTEKRNGTATTTTSTTLLSNQGNGGHHGNSYSGTLIHSNPSNGHGNTLYTNCNTSSSGLKLASEILAADMLDARTGERVRPKVVERESGEGDEVDEGLGDGLGEGIKGLEEELASFPMFKLPAPLAQCEESSI
ncbi:semaphorin-4F isoform X1 [Hippoglossus hippoglossus]|uniref:semaphorin-4F isoform X1 n=1 Tax=Hippoglossus hippoglossus TaxID=8267 RepID=UPI00148D2214|nr:semaphorin-4F isoform X1 [Hippoglossus hippoglossus]XP_034424624.1 semaphorin-4F isoform X1 [Hippoglossus hippoglossus]